LLLSRLPNLAPPPRVEDEIRRFTRVNQARRLDALMRDIK